VNCLFNIIRVEWLP